MVVPQSSDTNMAEAYLVLYFSENCFLVNFALKSTKEQEIVQVVSFFLLFVPLSPNIHIQLLLTDPHTFSYSISWENLLKDQSNFPLVIILLILITVSVDYASKLVIS